MDEEQKQEQEPQAEEQQKPIAVVGDSNLTSASLLAAVMSMTPAIGAPPPMPDFLRPRNRGNKYPAKGGPKLSARRLARLQKQAARER